MCGWMENQLRIKSESEALISSCLWANTLLSAEDGRLLKYDNPLGWSFFMLMSTSSWSGHLSKDEMTGGEFEWCTRWTEKLFNEVFNIPLLRSFAFSLIFSVARQTHVSIQNWCGNITTETRMENICKSESHWMSWENGNFTATHWEQQSKSVIIFTLHLCMHTWDGFTYSRKRERESSTLKQNSSSASIDEP